MKEYARQKESYDAEQKDFALNKCCEQKFVKLISNSNTDKLDTQVLTNIHHITEYSSVQGHLTLTL